MIDPSRPFSRGSMKDFPVYIAAFGFAVMGIGALIKPTLVTAQFGILALDSAGRNEVRAVYGGFGLMMSVALLVAIGSETLRAGILIAVACALGGMAAGRVLSTVIDRTLDKWPMRYLLLEAVVALMMYRAA
jgi:hypothetical protein